MFRILNDCINAAEHHRNHSTSLEATGVYSAFKGGHNHMVDKLHQLVAGTPFADFPTSGYDEFCFCNISTYQFP